MSKKTKTLLLCLGIFLLLAASSLGIWFLTKKEPVSKGNVLGIAWYDENGTEFTIDSIEELREFAALSEHYNFSGQTIKLSADIVDNEGNPMDWVDELPEQVWKPIKNFAGTFDGQGHTISGICGYGFVYRVRKGQTEFCKTGLFTDTKASCVIKDLRVVNSLFYNDFNEGAGSISSNGGGTFDSIYSSATIVTYKNNTGGIVGVLDATGSHTITNCWFDGEVIVQGNTGRYIGGIVGQVADTKGTNKIEHCLNTGRLSSTLDGTGVNLGGLVGLVMTSGRAQIKDCLSVGDITNEYGVAVGSVIGNMPKQSTANFTDVYATLESYKAVIGNQSGTTVGFPIEYSKSMLTGYGAYQWTTLDFENYWSVVEDDTPILKYFADEHPSIEGIEKCFDISWYDKSKSEYIISNVKQLYGFAMLSRSNDFSGKLVKLGADIVINEGNAADWAKEAPQYSWLTIGNVNKPFAGSFDGDMHSVSGVYMNTGTAYSGFFSTTSEMAAIKNFKLINSYMQSDAATFGSIVGRGRGNFDTIYSNAIVVGSKTNLGGIIGQIPGDFGVNMTNCWFDGSVTKTSNALADRASGGLVGVMYSDSVMNNCLNTGTVDASKYTTPNPRDAKLIVPLAGGIVGRVGKGTLTMSDCLNTGKIKVNKVATVGYGSIIGYVDGYVTIANTYALDDSCEFHATRHSLGGEVAVLDSSKLKGYGSYQWTLLDFDKYWAVKKTDGPILKSFASDIPSVAGVKKLYDISWYNAGKKSYVLDSMEDLHGFFLLSYNTNFEGKTIKLGADITVNTGSAAAWAQNAPKYKWMQIGSNNNPFKGTFDGQMHRISGVYLKTDTAYSGLFGATTNEATIKNLRLTNSYFETSALSFGSIVGRGRGTFDTIYSNAIVVSSTGNIGGIIGQVPGVSKIKINNCWFDGSVTATGNTTNDRRLGGIVGAAFSNGTISNCLNTGTIDASRYTAGNSNNASIVAPVAGGIIGSIGKNVETKVVSCLNVGKVLVSDAATTAYGPIVGYRDGTAKITDAYALGDSCKSFSQSRINGLVTAMDFSMLKGYGAYQWTFLDFDKYWAVVTESTPILKSFAGVVPSLAGIEKMIDYSWYDESKDTYVLTDVADLYGFAKLSKETNFAGKTVKLGANIVVNPDMNNPSYTWIPIGPSNKPFAGTFDGQMHSISGIYLKTTERFAGLFATTSTAAVIKNLSLKDSYIETTAGDCGSIVGRGQNSFDTVYSNATIISSHARVGGIVGQLYGDKCVINNCWFDGQITATGNTKNERGTGGIIGLYAIKNGSMTNCLNTGVIDASAYTCHNSTTSTVIAPLAGGLIGQVSVNGDIVIKNCLNSGEVKISQEAQKGTIGYGSVIGYTDGTVKVSDTYATTESLKIVSGGKPALISGKINQVSADTIKGYDGYQWTVLDFDKYWAVVLDDAQTANEDESGTPILKSFASVVPSLANVDKMIDFSWIDEAAGTEADPYILKDVADLYGLATLSAENNFAGKYIKLGADIVVNQGNASNWREKAPSYNWTPIGSLNLPFAGTFDGNMYSISGLYLNTTSRFSGLFGVTAGTAKIQNLKLKNSYMKTTAADFGSIVGIGNGEFHTIYSEAIIDCAAGRSGGMFGQASGQDTKITNCWYAGELINSTTNGQGIGGLVGVVVNGSKLTMTSCLNTGIVDASAYVTADKSGNVYPGAGGLIGQVGQGKAAEASVIDSLNVGSVIKNAKSTRGFGATVGYSLAKTTVSFTNVYGTKASSSRTATIFGAMNGSPTQVTKSIIGDDATTNMPKLDWSNTWTPVVNGTPVLSAFKNEVYDTSWYEKAEGTEADPYILYDRADLHGLATLSAENDFAGKYIKLGADIVVNQGNASNWRDKTPSYNWTPIGSLNLPFAGTFDGNMYSISGLYLNTTSRFSGLFGVTAGTAKIQNLKLKNSYMKTTAADFGSIVGIGNGEFHTIYSEAIIDCAAGRSGGMFGQASGQDTKITNCWYAGTLTNSTTNGQGTGGIVGVVVNGSKVTMQSCLNTGTVDVSAYTTADKSGNVYPGAGGLIGQVGQGKAAEASVIDSLNVGSVIKNAKSTRGFGATVGYSLAKTTVSFTNVYGTKASSSRTATIFGAMNGSPTQVTTSILGDNARTSMSELSWGTAWATVTEPEAGLPVLTSFIDMTK